MDSTKYLLFQSWFTISRKAIRINKEHPKDNGLTK